MADLMKIVREWEAKRQNATARAQDQEPARTEKVACDLPWPGYNGGKQFQCDLCHTYFDTSTGIAKHMVYGCEGATTRAPVSTRSMPSCPTCGGYALYREKDGRVTCQTCVPGVN